MRYKRVYPILLCFVGYLFVLGFLLGEPGSILPGLKTIIFTEDALITDYLKIAGPGAAFVNSALVTLLSIYAGLHLFGIAGGLLMPCLVLVGIFFYQKYRQIQKEGEP